MIRSFELALQRSPGPQLLRRRVPAARASCESPAVTMAVFHDKKRYCHQGCFPPPDSALASELVAVMTTQRSAKAAHPPKRAVVTRRAAAAQSPAAALTKARQKKRIHHHAQAFQQARRPTSVRLTGETEQQLQLLRCPLSCCSAAARSHRKASLAASSGPIQVLLSCRQSFAVA